MEKEINQGTKKTKRWKYIDDDGSFEWMNPYTINQLYFPICNEAGMMASVTPRLHGDATTGWHSFLRLPLVIQDLHNTRSARNFWVYIKDSGAWSLTGNSARQQSRVFTGEDNANTVITGTFLSHMLTREEPDIGIRAEITSFAPVTEDTVEIMLVKVTNISQEKLSFTPTAALPIYGRSADNLRDHNHWTSLTHRLETNEYGVAVKPEIMHDERGHKPNHTVYFAAGAGGDGEKPVGQFPTVAEFIGEGGTLDWPSAAVENLPPYEVPPNRRDGMEAVGAIRFKEAVLSPGEAVEYILVSGVAQEKSPVLECIGKYGNSSKAAKALEENHKYWREMVDRISFRTSDENFCKWMHWVALQPKLRKIYGNSFLPHFDYGRGGRGWRDLWQDCLALLLQQPDEMKESLFASFGGVRLDGSNATIIEKGLGKFSADRNKISRVWMDHGVWPYFTVRLYADQTGDLDIFFDELTYWKDHQIKRAKATDNGWKSADGSLQRDASGQVYRGSLLEHVLVQHLTCFHNVGDHNNMKLEDGDWNDLLDMANVKGETVPFSAFYGWNLITIADLLEFCMKERGMKNVSLFKELLILTNLSQKNAYESPVEKRSRLAQYFDAIDRFEGERLEVPIDKLAADLREKGCWVLKRIRSSEWIESRTGYGFFNGYYNNNGERVDGDHEDSTRMNLTAQTFAIMSGAASDEQVLKAFEAAKVILRDPNTGGFRLTTPLGPNTLNFGRGYAVVYGEKETGGTFNHMVVMFMNSLYRRGFVKEAYEVFKTVYGLPNNTEKAGIYPGIPEYISHEGKGMYHYLSGSASWLLMTVLTEMFGFRGEFGDLVIEPKLVGGQFNVKGLAEANSFFLGKRIRLSYINPARLDYGEYRISCMKLDGREIRAAGPAATKVRIQRKELAEIIGNRDNCRLEVYLEDRNSLVHTP